MKIVKYMAALLACAGVANADMITLGDASLENAFSGVNGTPGSGWFTFGSAVGGNQVDGGFWGPITNYDGPNAAYATDIGDSDGGSIYQTVTLDAGKTYRFTAAIAMSDAVNKCNGDYALVFYNSSFGSLLAQTTGVAINQGNVFLDDYVEFTPSTSANYQVGMRNRGYVAGTGANNNQATIFFDNARLSVIPEPATFGLALAASAAMLVRRRRFG